MAPAAQPLYCLPNDIYDWLSTEAVDLRLDDHNLATGQTITVRSNAVLADTALNILALRFPLIKGTNLEFDGGGMAAVVTVVLSATAVVGATSLTVVALDGLVNNQAQASDSGVNVALAQRLVKACNYGTDRVNRYCLGRYNASDLQTSWSANEWATTMGALWLCRRVCRDAPKGVLTASEDVLKELKAVQMGQMQVPGIGTRTAAWPFLDNTTVDPAYWNHKIRFQQSISEGTPTQFANYPDYTDAVGYDFGWW